MLREQNGILNVILLSDCQGFENSGWLQLALMMIGYVDDERAEETCAAILRMRKGWTRYELLDAHSFKAVIEEFWKDEFLFISVILFASNRLNNKGLILLVDQMSKFSSISVSSRYFCSARPMNTVLWSRVSCPAVFATSTNWGLERYFTILANSFTARSGIVTWAMIEHEQRKAGICFVVDIITEWRSRVQILPCHIFVSANVLGLGPWDWFGCLALGLERWKGAGYGWAAFSLHIFPEDTIGAAMSFPTGKWQHNLGGGVIS